MISEYAALAGQGIELVELRVDCIRRDVNLARLLRDRPCDAVVTCRREDDGGRWKGTEEDRLTILRTAIAEQVAYVDLESDIAAQIPRFGKTKRVISLHDFAKTPDDLDAVYDELKALDPDIIKIATMANNPHDNVRMLQLVRKADVPTVGLCMGEIGIPTRLLGVRYGAPFTFATFHQERALAPGQLSFRRMHDEFNFDRINEDTELYGVIGDPIGHSLSPLVFNAAFRELDLNKAYLPFRVPSENLEQFIEDAPTLGIRGLSVTIPHKEAVLNHCDRIDGAVRGIGAANTLVFQEDGICAFNTDYRAAMRCLDERLDTAARRTPLAGHTALILGAGGAARAIAFGLVRRGADVAIAGRTLIRAERMARNVGCRAVPWENRYATKADVIINATPVGMHPNVNETPFDMHYFRPNAIVFDTVYNPEHTLFLKEAAHRNCRVISGVEMFIGQAALQFTHFTGLHAPVGRLEETFRRAIGAVRY
jgi:3-dehydroquinate dehydratase/shikimate dehydrogenase